MEQGCCRLGSRRSVYANPIFGIQPTGGSTSIRAFFTPLRQAGAAAREMLRQAAVTECAVPVSKCTAVRGMIGLDAHIRSIARDTRARGQGASADALGRQIEFDRPTTRRIITKCSNGSSISLRTPARG
jgi:CO/xanthine dehydrogenase Mo-binding subunit